MNELFPIIRRKRRPLLPVDEPVEKALGASDKPYLTPALSLPLLQAGEGDVTKVAGNPRDAVTETSSQNGEQANDEASHEGESR